MKNNKIYDVALYYTILTRERGNLIVERENENWINIDEAAEYLGIKTVTFRTWLKKDNRLPAHKIGKMWRFKKCELDAWIKSGESAIE